MAESSSKGLITTTNKSTVERHPEIIETEYDKVRVPWKECPPLNLSRIPKAILAPHIACKTCNEELVRTMTCTNCLSRYCTKCVTKQMFLTKGKNQCITCTEKGIEDTKLACEEKFDLLVKEINEKCPSHRLIYHHSEVCDSNGNMLRGSEYARDHKIQIPSRHRKKTKSGSFTDSPPKLESQLDSSGSSDQASSSKRIIGSSIPEPVADISPITINITSDTTSPETVRSRPPVLYNEGKIISQEPYEIPWLKAENTKAGKLVPIKVSPHHTITETFKAEGAISNEAIYIKASPNLTLGKIKVIILNRLILLKKNSPIKHIRLCENNVDIGANVNECHLGRPTNLYQETQKRKLVLDPICRSEPPVKVQKRSDDEAYETKEIETADSVIFTELDDNTPISYFFRPLGNGKTYIKHGYLDFFFQFHAHQKSTDQK
uniref:RING-type domain-containing protein n=1 Tax=Rhabditophanes sp. KR3021 TaxID=114890 RepID=A0AC35U609_9BILA